MLPFSTILLHFISDSVNNKPKKILLNVKKQNKKTCISNIMLSEFNYCFFYYYLNNLKQQFSLEVSILMMLA